MADMRWPSYLSGLHSYLLSFTKRTQPLVDVEAAQLQVEGEFDRLWEEGKIEGWTSGPQTDGNGAIWCPACSSWSLLFKS
jgi:splicing factor 3A subunit 3